jgi:hypothetical protein
MVEQWNREEDGQFSLFDDMYVQTGISIGHRHQFYPAILFTSKQ